MHAPENTNTHFDVGGATDFSFAKATARLKREIDAFDMTLFARSFSQRVQRTATRAAERQ